MEKNTRIKLDYFLALESDLLNFSRYIEFATDNYDAYSMELVRLLLAAGSEVDIACKQLCRLVNPKNKRGNISNYRAVLLKRFPEIQSQVVCIRRHNISFQPWNRWGHKHPAWWVAYNCVKHNRLVHFRDGNLRNVLNAVAGLGVIMQFFGDVLHPTWNFNGTLFDLHLRLQEIK